MEPPDKPHQYGSICRFSWEKETSPSNETIFQDDQMQSILSTYAMLTKSLITFLSGFCTKYFSDLLKIVIIFSVNIIKNGLLVLYTGYKRLHGSRGRHTWHIIQ